MKRILLILLTVLCFVTRAQAQELDYEVYLPVILKMIITPDIDNNWRIIQPLASSNKVLNPSAETTGNFSAVAGGAPTRETTYQKYGLYSYRLQPVASGDGIQLTTLTLGNEHHYVTVRVRQTAPALQASLNGNAKPLTLIEKIDADWDLYGASFGASLANGATSVQILALASGDFYIDGIQVEPQTVWTTYIDGTQDGCAWLGSPHAASSERSGESRAGGVSYDFWEQYGFQLQRIIGAGASSHNLGVDNYAILPGGELNSDKIEPRDFTIIGKFIANTEEEIHKNRQDLEAAFQVDDNQLNRIRFNGATVQKEIAVRYQNGLEGDLAAFYGAVEIIEDEKYMERELFTERASIQVVAPYPFWLEVGESAANLDTSDSVTTFEIVAGRLRSTGQWSPLGPPNAAGTYNTTRAIVEDDIYVYFGGNFQNFDNIANADYIVRYNKRTGDYSALDIGLNSWVYAMAIAPNGDLYIGGLFTNAGGVAAADYLTRWDGTNFNAVGTPNTGAAAITSVNALAFDLLGNLYIGGSFFNWADIANADHIVMWDGSSYNALSTGVNPTVLALAISPENLLWIGGSFVGGPGSYVLTWDGSSFDTPITGLDAAVRAIAINSVGLVYFGGSFTTPATRIGSWNGTAVSDLTTGVDGDVYSLSIGVDDFLYVSGNFSTAGAIDVLDHIARWNRYAWAHLDLNLNGSPIINAVLASRYADPVVEQNYNIWLGHDVVGGGDSAFAGLVTVTNEGTVQAYPKIVYARSGGTTAAIETLRNERTGKELLFDYSLLDGETLIIDLDPLQKSIISSFWGLRMDAVLANSDFGVWALSRGNNPITTYVNESGTPTLVHYMQWRDAYSGYD